MTEPNLQDVLGQAAWDALLSGENVHHIDGVPNLEEMGAVVLAAWREACTVRTDDQLDALPFLSVVREVFRPSPVAGVDYGGVWERRTSGWQPLSGSIMPPGYSTPRLPTMLLWNPDWSE